MQDQIKNLGARVRMPGPFDVVLARTVEALKIEGFGVLTEIDVQATMKNKLNVDVPRYRILGACNPPLAHRALSAAPEVGLLLPCNVTVRELEDGTVEVALVDPMTLLSVVEQPELDEVAREAGSRLERVAQSLRGG